MSLLMKQERAFLESHAMTRDFFVRRTSLLLMTQTPQFSDVLSSLAAVQSIGGRTKKINQTEIRQEEIIQLEL